MTQPAFGALLFLLVPGIAAQQTWVVDASNRAGTHFTTLAAAFTAAQDGDVLIVRNGSYSTITTNKGLRIFGQPGAVIANGLGSTDVLVEGLPAGRDFVLSGFTFPNHPFAAPLAVQNCLGRIHFEKVTTTVTGFRVDNCSQVSIANAVVQITSGSGLRLQNSRVHVVDSQLTGALGPVGSFAAVTMTGGELVLSHSSLAGGNGLAFGPAAGLRLQGGSVIVTGGSRMNIRSGTGSTTGASAIDGVGSVTIHPQAVLTSWLGAPVIGPNVAVTTVSVPTLRAPGTPLGGVVTLQLEANPGERFALFLGLAGDGLPLAGVGTFWIDPPTMAVVTINVMDPSGVYTLPIPVPQATALRGPVIRWQVLTADNGNVLKFSNAVTYVHD